MIPFSSKGKRKMPKEYISGFVQKLPTYIKIILVRLTKDSLKFASFSVVIEAVETF